MGSVEPPRGRVLAAVVAVPASAILWFLSVGIGTGFVPVGALAWLAPLPVLLLAARVTPLPAFLACFAAFLLGTANSWGFFTHSGDVPLPMGIAIVLVLSAAFAGGALLHRALLCRGRVLLAGVTPAALWTVLLHLIQLLNPTGLMGTLANSQGDLPVVLQTAAVAGPWGVEFLVLAAPCALAAACAPGMWTRLRVRGAVCCALLVAVPLGGGAVRLATTTPAITNSATTNPATTNPATTNPTSTRRVALVAHNHSEWGVDVATPTGHDLVSAYRDRIAALPPDVHTVVLPEGAFSVRDSTMDSLIAPLRELATEQHRTIVVGYMHERTEDKLNVALTLPADGGAPVPYLKWHDTVAKAGADTAQVPGAEPATGVLICGDINQPTPSRNYGRNHTGLLLVPASDENDNGWQHSRMAVLRGVENGFATAWSGRQGALVVSDAQGRIHAETRTGDAAPFSTLVADVPVAPGGTPAATFGDWFAWLCWPLTLIGLLGFVRCPSRAERAGTSRGR